MAEQPIESIDVVECNPHPCTKKKKRLISVCQFTCPHNESIMQNTARHEHKLENNWSPTHIALYCVDVITLLSDIIIKSNVLMVKMDWGVAFLLNVDAWTRVTRWSAYLATLTGRRRPCASEEWLQTVGHPQPMSVRVTRQHFRPAVRHCLFWSSP